MNINDHREDIREVLAGHFILWHPLNGPGEPGPRGEWRCECGEKFGFSDTAIAHQADALLASPALARLLAAARDEARAEARASGAGCDHAWETYLDDQTREFCGQPGCGIEREIAQ